MTLISPRPLSLMVLFTTSALGMITKLMNRKVRYDFPQVLGEYTLKKRYTTYAKPQMFAFAIYENSKKEKAIAKLWSGKVKDFAYFTLRNEVAVYQCLTDFIKRNASSIPRKYRNVRIPRLITIHESKNTLILLIEYIVGYRAERLSRTMQCESYFRSIGYLQYLGRRIPKSYQARIAKRGVVSFSLLYPLLLTKSLLTNPRAAAFLLRGVPIFLSSVPLVLAYTRIGLSHRDLHLGNILVKGKYHYIIDLQFCLYSLVGYDMATSLRLCWNNVTFRRTLLHALKKRYKHVRRHALLICGLMVYSATHALTANNFSKTEIGKIIDYLNFAVQPNAINSYGYGEGES